MNTKKMLAINYQTDDPFAIYGIRHFIQKFGLPVKININEPSKICISYGNSVSSGEFTIEVPEKQIENEFSGCLGIDEQEIPVFELIDRDTSTENNRIILNLDVFKEVGHILSGHLENLPEEQKKKIAKIPLVDIYEKFLFDKVLFASKQLNVSIESKPLWPNGKSFAVCLTHDVDEIRKTYQYFTRPLIHARRLEFGRALYHIKSFLTDKISGNNPYWTFEEIMNLEDELGVRSTFFFLQEDARVELSKPETWRHYGRRYRFDNIEIIKLINKLSSGGWEIGLHGSFYSYNNKKKLMREKKDLEEALGGKIHGIRQHNLNLKIPETWQYQEEIGLEYDTSLGPKGNTGFRWGTSFPFYPLNPENGRPVSILEVPLSIMDIHLFRSKKNAWNEFLEVLKMVEKHNGLLTVLFHHTVFNDREYPAWTDMYKKIINLCKEKGAWITNANEINKWWRSRKNGNNS